MSQMPQKRPSPIRATTPEALRLAKTLIRTANYGTLAVLDPRDGRPFASRVSIATDFDGTPLTLISQLSFHTKALLADARCSLLLGEPGKGDPLAHPRISLSCDARFLDRGSPASQAASARFLRCNPKSRLYAGFADFSFAHLEIRNANLNGGFGQAFEISGQELLSPESETLRAAEPKLIEDLNGKDNQLIVDFAVAAGLKAFRRAIVTSLDTEGMDIGLGGKTSRLWFSNPVSTMENLMEELKCRSTSK